MNYFNKGMINRTSGKTFLIKYQVNRACPVKCEAYLTGVILSKKNSQEP